MNGIGHHVVFGYSVIPARERMRALKAAGFDEVMLWWGDEHLETHGAPRAQWEMARESGLRVRTVHYPFALTNALWLDNQAGRDYEQGLFSGLALAAELAVEHMVIHTNKGKTPPGPNPLGLHRLRKVVERAEELGVILALENTRFLRHLAYLYEGITSPFLGFCFDSGHASAFTPGSDPLALFGHRLVTTHLSDNLSPEAGDLHLRPGLGTVDFSSLIPRILALKPGISLNLESVRSQQDAQARLDLTAYLKASYAGIARHIDGPASGRRDVFI